MPLHDVSPGSLGDVRCRVFNSTTFGLVSDTSNHPITFDSTDYDPRGMHSNVTNNSRITVPISGRWWVYGHILYQIVDSSTGVLLGIRKNGGTSWGGLQSIEGSSGGNQPYRTASGFMDLIAGDYVELVANQNHGSTCSAERRELHLPGVRGAAHRGGRPLMPAPFSVAPTSALLAQSNQVSGAASIDFSGLNPSDWTYFQVVWQLCTSNAADQKLRFQVNGDSTAAHYAWLLIDYAGASGGGGSETAGVLGWIPASSQTFGAGVGLIPCLHAGSTRGGGSWYACEGTANHGGVATTNLGFQIASPPSSIHLFADAGNLNGSVTVWGIP